MGVDETPIFFATQEELHKWFKKHYKKLPHQWVGYYKKGSGRESITWPQSVEEALCFGWIDGLRKSHDAESYKIRFTPRRQGSIWSVVNIKMATELAGAGRMTPEGLAAFEARKENKSGIYSFEQEEIALPAEYEKEFKRNKKAWAWWGKQPPSYKKPAIWWVVSAKREDTRTRRLATLIADSAEGVRIKHLRR